MIGDYKIGTPKTIRIDECVCSGSRAYSIKCGVKKTNKLNGISKSQSRSNKSELYKQCLDG